MKLVFPYISKHWQTRNSNPIPHRKVDDLENNKGATYCTIMEVSTTYMVEGTDGK